MATTAVTAAPLANTGASVELHIAPANGAFPFDVQLSNVDAGLAGLGNVVTGDFSLDSQWMTYAADNQVDGLFQWFSVPTGAAGPGSEVQLSNAITTVSLSAITPNSAFVVYASDNITSGIQEIFTTSIGTGGGSRLNPFGMMGAGVSDLTISDNGVWVGYLAEGNTAGVTELYSADVLGPGTGIRINDPPLGAGQGVSTVNIGPDSLTVLYESDQNGAGIFELFNVPILGGPSNPLHLSSPDSTGLFTGLGTPIIGRRALYPVFGAAVDLFAVPFDGVEPAVQLNDVLGAGDALFSGFFSDATPRMMAYAGGPSAGTVTDKIWSVPIRRDFPPEQLNVTAPGGADGVIAYVIDPNEDYGVYIQDQDFVALDELFVKELDTDGDAVVNVNDNCKFIANPAQGPVVFPFTIFALADKQTFTWGGTPTEVRWARGAIATVSSYTVSDSGTVLDNTRLTPTAAVGPGDADWYLFADHCPGRSHQTTLGNEPGRDAAALP